MLVPLGYLQYRFGDGPARRARDAYLGVFADRAPHDELVETLELACRVAKIARTLTWDRAIQAAREQGEPIDPDWATAPAETLERLLDDDRSGDLAGTACNARRAARRIGEVRFTDPRRAPCVPPRLQSWSSPVSWPCSAGDGPDWSPDGARILFRSPRTTRSSARSCRRSGRMAAA